MMARVLEYHPEDMTVTAEAGLLLSDLQAQLRQSGQWLPIDPPFPERTTISELIAQNLSGPRRYAFGTIREHLLGLSARLADGRVIKSGGKVVKNVAGYDFHKLFVGSRGSLGTILQATFKVRPLPEKEVVLSAEGNALEKVLESELCPVVFDLLPSAMIIAMAGTAEEVDWQIRIAKALGFSEGGTLDYDREFWLAQPTPWQISALPSQLLETIRGLRVESFVARAGNGLIYYRGGKQPASPRSHKLSTRLKSVFDPENKLPSL